MTRVSVFIPHQVVFPGEACSFEAFRDLLRTLSRTETLMTCARFNQTLANTGHHEEHAIQDSAAHRFVGSEQLDRIITLGRTGKVERGGTPRCSFADRCLS